MPFSCKCITTGQSAAGNHMLSPPRETPHPPFKPLPKLSEKAFIGQVISNAYKSMYGIDHTHALKCIADE